MQKRLYLLCPTDCLEPIVTDTFGCDNYFYYALGTSVQIEENTIDSIKRLVQKHQIEEISFVLSDNNHIVNDALGKQNFIAMRGLSNLYYQIIKHKRYSELFYQSDQSQFSVLSYYLNNKIKELEIELRNRVHSPLEINGKVYDRNHKIFKKIYADLICVSKHSLN